MNFSISCSSGFIARLLSSALLTALCAQAFAEDAVVGWVEKPDINAVTIVRNDVNMPKGTSDLLACDVVKLNDVAATAHITLASYQRLLLDGHTSEGKIRIPCKEMAPWFGRQLDLVKTIVAAATAPGRRFEAIAATRAEDQPSPIEVPALGDYDPMLVAGERSLYVAWTGGVAPFTVSVLRADGTAVTSQDGIRAHVLSLPSASYAPGRYSLVVKGIDGHGVRESGLTVVEASKLPPRPAILSHSSLPSADEKLLYAYFLEGWGKGEWTLEALQQAASITPPTPASSDWIEHRFAGKAGGAQ
jgi:hypothetical protein